MYQKKFKIIKVSNGWILSEIEESDSMREIYTIGYSLDELIVDFIKTVKKEVEKKVGK